MALSKLDKRFLKYKTIKSPKKAKSSDKLHQKYGEIDNEKKSSKLFARKHVAEMRTGTHQNKFFNFLRTRFSKTPDAEKTQKSSKKIKVTKPLTKEKKEKTQNKKHDTVEETDIRKIFKKRAKEKKKKISAAERKRKLDDYLEKSGLAIRQQGVSKIIFYFSIISALMITIIWIILAQEGSIIGTIIQVMIIWTLGFILIWGSAWIFFRIYLDLLMFRRKLSMEEVLPDFLQLTSANLRAGMPIDRALWFAVRPRFGVLANEIEDVAKRTIAGDDLNDALLNFARKYDSQVLLRSVYLLIEGMEAGGDIASLLNKIALNIQEMRSMKKEMSANVTTYVIFISFAAMIAAPALFGLSSQLLGIVQNIAAQVTSSGEAQTSGIGLSINMDPNSIKMSDYQVFAYLCLGLSSIFSGIIVATIKKGNVKEGLHYIPIFLIVSITVYFLVSKLLGLFMGGLF